MTERVQAPNIMLKNERANHNEEKLGKAHETCTPRFSEHFYSNILRSGPNKIITIIA